MYNEQLKFFREAKGLSQVQLAELSGVSRTSISDIERSRHDGTIRVLLKWK